MNILSFDQNNSHFVDERTSRCAVLRVRSLCGTETDIKKGRQEIPEKFRYMEKN